MTGKQNISQVVKQKLCNTCGACFTVCNSGAIEYKETVSGYYFPIVDKEKCIDCGLCFSVCPGIGFSEELKQRMPEDPFAGQSLRSFVGKATDKGIYENSQSGGIVSALLVYALESHFADAAVTVVMDWGNPPHPKVYLARSNDEIISSQKSKYCPVPALSAIKEIINSEQRIVFVGTSCQVHGLFNIMDIMPKLKDRVSLIIGLVCDRVMTYAAIDYLIYRSGLPDSNKKLLTFRDKSCGGYPGKVHIQSVDGQNRILPVRARGRIKDFFTPARCRLCFDKMNVFSDIVVGDPHGIRNVDRKMGESIAVIRTQAGLRLFQSAFTQSVPFAREIPYSDVLAGQAIKQKRTQWMGYTSAWKMLGQPTVDYGDKVLKNAGPIKKNTIYKKNLQRALSLDLYASRDELITAAEKYVVFRTLKRIAVSPYLIMRKVLGWLQRQAERRSRCL
jgi:coenzyme F420 hydrogenase subunit beta